MDSVRKKKLITEVGVVTEIRNSETPIIARVGRTPRAEETREVGSPEHSVNGN